MKQLKYKLKTEISNNLGRQTRKILKTLPQYKTKSCLQIIQTGNSKRVVNDNFINTFNPKRTSSDLSCFIQIFRKKVRQSSIARQFQNSLQKFESIRSNRVNNLRKQKGGFVGNHKKLNQLLIQNNITDSKIKKIIISDMQFKDRKMGERITIQLQKPQSLPNQPQTQNKLKMYKNKMKTYSLSQVNNNQSRLYSQAAQQVTIGMGNPQHAELTIEERELVCEKSGSQRKQCRNKSHGIFNNRKLETLASYQRPNLMYNLSLYRKRHSNNVLKSNNKKIINV